LVPALEHLAHRNRLAGNQLVVPPSPLVYDPPWLRRFRLVGFVFSDRSIGLSPADPAAGFRAGSSFILIGLYIWASKLTIGQNLV